MDMDVFTAGVWVLTVGFLVFSFVKDKHKTKESVKKALGMGKGMLISIISIIFAIGLLLAIFTPESIAVFVEKQNVLIATISAALLGTVTLVPAFIAFPLVGTLINGGVGIVPSVSFITTLTMVGVVTFPLEIKSFGRKFTFIRNALSFIFAIIIALVMGVII
jgi:uncharacterized membrane protein YraQ (UPF0718 family)